MKNNGPRVLLIDIETSPIIAQVWALWDQNVGFNQIQRDSSIIAWGAKWLDDPDSKVHYRDLRNAKSIEDDKDILKDMWKLLDEADIVVGQNHKDFDIKRLNARFVIHGMQPPSSYKVIDTRQIARSKFGFTSNSLEYLSTRLDLKFKKLKHKKFPGHELWSECLKGNKAAWKEMEAYNKRDVLALQELYLKLRSWDSSINFSLYNDTITPTCSCGSTKFKLNGFAFTASGKFQRYCCTSCGAETRSKQNLFSKDQRKAIRTK